MVDREESDLDILVGLATEDTVDEEVIFFINNDTYDEYDLDDTNDDKDILTKDCIFS